MSWIGWAALAFIVLSYPVFPMVMIVLAMRVRFERWLAAGRDEAGFDRAMAYAALLIYRVARWHRPWLNKFDTWIRSGSTAVYTLGLIGLLLVWPFWLDFFERCATLAVDREISRRERRSKRK